MIKMWVKKTVLPSGCGEIPSAAEIIFQSDELEVLRIIFNAAAQWADTSSPVWTTINRMAAEMREIWEDKS